jgi:hypothetical protein
VINVACNLNSTYTLTAGSEGRYLLLRMKQDATGSRTIAFDTSVKFGSDLTAYTATTTASKTDCIGLQYNLAATAWFILAVAHGY